MKGSTKIINETGMEDLYMQMDLLPKDNGEKIN